MATLTSLPRAAVVARLFADVDPARRDSGTLHVPFLKVSCFISRRLCETTAVDGSSGRSLSPPRPPRHARTSRQQALTTSSKFGRAMPWRRSRATCRKQSISCLRWSERSVPVRACAARASIATRCAARGRQRRPMPGVPRPRPDGCPLLRGHTP
jgi:hypothetical protein